MDFIPYGRHDVNDDDIEAVKEVLCGEWLTTGPAVTVFESDLARVVGAQTVAVSSGTAALHSAYAAVGVSAGDEVITSPLSFASTATTAVQLGASVVFADIEDDYLTLDAKAVESAVTNRTKVVTTVDFAGQVGDLDRLRSLTSGAGVILLEDAAHSIGSSYKGQPVGSLADVTTFSFHPVKTITTAEGGAISSHTSEVLQRVREFRNHGLVRDPERQRRPDGGWHQEVHALGLNYRMPDVLAALGSSQLRRLSAWKKRRDELVARYRDELSDLPSLRFQKFRPKTDTAWHLFVVRILDGRRRNVFDAMRSKGIGVQVHYLPIYLHPVFQDLGYKAGACPVAEQAYEELLSLPLYATLTDQQQERIIVELKNALT